MNLIIGLGNPGFGYSHNRHNIGFLCLNSIAKEHKIPFNQKKGHARIGTGTIAGQPVMLAKPQTFMNASGQSVSELMRIAGASLDDLVVIHDDMDLPLGKIRIRRGSSSGGHKGAQSIIETLANQDFVRIRVGVGRPTGDVVRYVLGNFSRQEEEEVVAVIDRVCRAVVVILTDGLVKAMNEFNG